MNQITDVRSVTLVKITNISIVVQDKCTKEMLHGHKEPAGHNSLKHARYKVSGLQVASGAR